MEHTLRVLHTSDWHLGRTLYGRKRHETFAAEYLVELCQRTRTVGAFVQPIGWTHELVDETTEDRRRMTGAVVRFGQHLLQNVSNPTMAS